MSIFWSLDDRCIKGSVSVTNSEGKQFTTPKVKIFEEFLVPYFDDIWDGISSRIGKEATSYDGHDDAIPLKDHLDAIEAAELSGYGVQHIRRLCRSGALEGAVLRRGKWFIPKSSMEGYRPGPKGFAAAMAKNR